MDEGKNGVVYFSLGSIAQANLMPEKFLKPILAAFAQLPYRILMKFEGELQGVSENVFIKPWMPQQDVLGNFLHS